MPDRLAEPTEHQSVTISNAMQLLGFGTRAFEIHSCTHGISAIRGVCGGCGKEHFFSPARVWGTLLWVPTVPLWLSAQCPDCGRPQPATGSLVGQQMSAISGYRDPKYSRHALTYWFPIAVLCGGAAWIGHFLSRVVGASELTAWIVAGVLWFLGVLQVFRRGHASRVFIYGFRR